MLIRNKKFIKETYNVLSMYAKKLYLVLLKLFQIILDLTKQIKKLLNSLFVLINKVAKNNARKIKLKKRR